MSMCKLRKVQRECAKCKKEHGNCLELSSRIAAAKADNYDACSELNLGIGYRLMKAWGMEMEPV